MKTEIKKVPSNALKYSLGEIELGDNGENAKTAPVRLKALGGEVIDHWFFGPIVHDLQGMAHKQRIAIDYNHDAEEILGYVNRFDANQQLELSGAIVPYKDSDRASEVIYKMKAGVPYQASIDYTPTKPDEIQMEILGEGQAATVNGRSVVGPLSIVRKWKLGGVAICPYGADSDTEAYLQSKGDDKQKEITIMSAEEAKKEELDKAVEEEVAEAVTVDTEAEEKKETEAVETAESEAVEAEVEETHETSEECKLGHADFVQMIERFGKEKAVDYFEQGLSMDEATVAYHKQLEDENKALKEQLAHKKAGFSPEKDKGKEKLSVNEEALRRYAESVGKSFDELKAKFTK